MSPQPLLLSLPCPACGRPGRERSPCPWCGERLPAAPRTPCDLARLAAGLALLALGAATRPPGTALAALAAFHCGFFLAVRTTGREGGGGASAFAGTAGSSLFAALLAFALRAFGAPYPVSSAVRLAWLPLALAAAAFALRVPAEAPNAPAFGASARERAWRRRAPDLVAALSLVPFAVAFAAGAPAVFSLLGLALVLGAWLPRLASPAVPLLLAAAYFALLLPDPAFLAFGMLARPLWRGLRPARA